MFIVGWTMKPGETTLCRYFIDTRGDWRYEGDGCSNIFTTCVDPLRATRYKTREAAEEWRDEFSPESTIYEVK